VVLAGCNEAYHPVPRGKGLGIDVVPDTTTLTLNAPGNTRHFTAVVNNATNTGVIWRSSVPSVVAVNASGLATAVAPGQAHIIALSVADTVLRATGSVIVIAGEVPAARSLTRLPPCNRAPSAR
jgi:uncharacterized protein YjdB